MIRLIGLIALPGCMYLEEQRTAPTSVYWSGTVLDGPYAEDVGVLAEGSFEVLDLDGALLAEGVPFEDSPGDWYVEVPVDTEAAVRLGGDGYLSTVFRDRTPTGRAYWYDGALFVRTEAELDAIFDELAAQELLSDAPGKLSRGRIAHLWGGPLDPLAWVDATVTVTDGAGTSQQAILLDALDDGTIAPAGADGVDLFLAVDLAPGTVTVEVDGPGGAASWTCPAQGGDLLHPIFFNLGAAEQDE